jgi:hypothetical protein
MATRKHYVEFFSPGTFVSESSVRPLESWDIAAACEIANGIQERHNAKPYGFRFKTMLTANPVPDGEGGTLAVQPREVAKSGMHFLGGRLIRYEHVPDDKEHSILRSNMRSNNYPVVIENTNSWRFTGEFAEDAVIVDADGSILARGDDPELMEYRKRKAVDFDREREAMMAEWRARSDASIANQM